jgi:GT2 family glycosyltransferase
LGQKTNHTYEIIVVGQDKWDLVEKFQDVKFIKTTAPVNASTARNIGISEAKGEWFLFIDSDCVASVNWMETFLSQKNSGWKVIGGGIKTASEPYWPLVYNLSMFHAQLASKPRAEHPYLPTLNLAIHREVYEVCGGMDESLVRGQDIDWTIRMTKAGFKLLFEPDASITHFPARNDLETLKCYFMDSGYYMIRVRYRYPEIYNMSPLLQNAWIWRSFAGVIAAWTTFRIFMKSKEVSRHLNTFHHMCLLKKSWCLGAADGLEEMQNHG